MSDIHYLKMQEFTNQLITVFQKSIYNDIVDLWYAAKEVEKENLYKNTQNLYQLFQDNLEEIPKWNRIQIHESFQSVTSKYSEEYIDKLMHIVFTLNIKFLLDDTKSMKTIRIPDNETFYHQCLLQVAAAIFPTPYIFDIRFGNHQEKYKNSQKIQEIIREGIRESIRMNIMGESLFSSFETETQNPEGVELTDSEAIEPVDTGYDEDGNTETGGYEDNDEDENDYNDTESVKEIPNIAETETGGAVNVPMTEKTSNEEEKEKENANIDSLINSFETPTTTSSVPLQEPQSASQAESPSVPPSLSNIFGPSGQPDKPSELEGPESLQIKI